jgi:uncharacterized membrane protein YqhA
MRELPEKAVSVFEEALLRGRFILYFAVFGSMVCALICMVVGCLVALKLAWDLIAEASISSAATKLVAVGLVEVIDLFLLGTVFYIVATGLYSIFINDKITEVRWMEAHTLDALKAKIVGVVIVLLAVTFLGNVVQWKGGYEILALGGAVGLVLTSLAVLLNFGHNRTDDHPLR